MKKEKTNIKSKKTKKYKMTNRTWIILSIFSVFIIGLIIFLVTYMTSEKYEKKVLERKLSNWAEEYYTEKLTDVASEYIKDKASNDENVTINLDVLKKFGKDTEIVKNSRTNKQCDDIDSYVVIKVDKDAKDIKKDYKVEKVVLDCFK